MKCFFFFICLHNNSVFLLLLYSQYFVIIIMVSHNRSVLLTLIRLPLGFSESGHPRLMGIRVLDTNNSFSWQN